MAGGGLGMFAGRPRLQSVSERQTPYVRAAPARDVIKSTVDSVARENPLSQQSGQLHHEDARGNTGKPASDIVR